jgi:hypothetical protein
MTYCALRSSLTAQPPITIPEIALRLGVHPSYYRNGIEVLELDRLPMDREFGPAAGARDANMSDLVSTWARENETLVRVVPVGPPPIREDGRHIWRFDGGPHANEEVFLPGQTVPQWDVDTRTIGLRTIAVVPPGGVLLITSADELAGQEEEDGWSADAGLIVTAASFSVAATFASEEATAHHEPGHAFTAHHEPEQEPAAYHDPGHEGADSHAGLDDPHLGGQDAVQAAEDYFNSESQAADDIIGNMRS